MLTSGLTLPSETGPRPEKSDTSSSVAPKEYRKRPEMVLPTAIAFFPVAGDMTLHSPVGVTSPSFPAAKTSTCPGFCCYRRQCQTCVSARGVGTRVTLVIVCWGGREFFFVGCAQKFELLLLTRSDCDMVHGSDSEQYPPKEYALYEYTVARLDMIQNNVFCYLTS